MPATSSPQARRTSLLAFVTIAAVALCAAEPVCARQGGKSPPEVVKLSVRISVTDREGGSPVRGAEVTIRRQGANAAGIALRDRVARTDAKGEVGMTELDFRLGGPPHKVVVTAEHFRKLELEVPDVVLREAAHIDGQLTLALSLAGLSGQAISPYGQSEPTPTATEPEPSLLYQPHVWVSAAVLTFISIIVFVAWRAWLGLGYRRQVAPAAVWGKAAPSAARAPVDLESLNQRLSLISREMRKLATKEEVQTLANALTSVTEILKDLRRTTAVNAVAAPPPVENKFIRPLLFKERAHFCYLKLAEGVMPDVEPLYVKADAKSTLFGKLADSNVYLLQEGHRQAAFVLFSEDDRRGWVFPNPALPFRPGALKDVFPNLTEAEFESAKERIEPAPVSRVGEARWKLDTAG